MGSVFPDILDNLIGDHRGYGHSILWIIPCLVIMFFNFTIGFAVMVGIISHLILDSMTTHGIPVLYPIRKTSFIVLNQKRRVKTGTNQDKAVFLALLLLLITSLFFTIASMQIDVPFTNPVFATQNVTTDKITNLNTSEGLKSNINLNIQLTQKTHKNITVKKVNENETTYLINDIEPGG